MIDGDEDGDRETVNDDGDCDIDGMAMMATRMKNDDSGGGDNE